MTQIFRLLVVEDDADLASNLKDILEEEGYDVSVTSSGRAAMDLCRKRHFDLALMDMELPDAVGLSLTQSLGEMRPEMEYVVMTAHGGLDTAVAAVRHKKIIGYETKPLDMMRFIALIRQVRDRHWAEEALRQSETGLRLVLEQMPCTLWTADAELRVTSSMGSAADLAVAPLKRVIGEDTALSATENDAEPTPLAAHRSALAGVPDSYELEWLGKTLYCHVEPLRDLSKSIIGVVGIAIDMSEQKHYEEELRALSRKLAQVQERERGLVARELHDELGQMLTALKISLDRAATTAQGDTGRTLRESSDMVGNMMSWVREFSMDFRPTMLDDLGLGAAMLWYVGRFNTQTGIHVSLKHSGLPQDIPADVGTAAYRIVQEALTNTARHAHVKEASVRLWVDDGSLFVQIEDRGSGFNTSSRSASKATGISGMRERALGVSGKFTLKSAPGCGACVTAELPLSTRSRVAKQRRVHA